MDLNITKKEILEGAAASLETTRANRYQDIKWTAELQENKYVLKSEQGILSLDIDDEILLYTIMKFRFMPEYLARQYDKEKPSSSGVIGSQQSSDKIQQMINFGLIYQFPSAIGTFLMPTNKLASLFNEKLGSFKDPPYNTLTHTISEEKVMLDCMSGRAKYIENLPHLPFVSNLGLGQKEKGCTVIPEEDYSRSKTWMSKNDQLLNNQEATLIREILDGKVVTSVDLKEQEYVIRKKTETGEYDFKIADLTVPALRRLDDDNVAVPQSIALEVELTNKGKNSYTRLLDLYWDNLKYGHCIYLTNNSKIKTALIEAVRELQNKHLEDGIEQTCKFYIEEFIIPYEESSALSI